MNFDGKAYVKNTSDDMFVSEHGHAFVLDSQFNNNNRKSNSSFVLLINNTNINSLNNNKIFYEYGFIPYTVQVYEQENIYELIPKTFIITKDCIKHNKQDNLLYTCKKTYVSRLQPTNVKYNPKSAIVIDLEQKETNISFTGVSVNVNSKVEIVIPDKPINYQDMSIIIQKNSFIEIKLPDNVSEVINLPENLIYLTGYIKGTFTKSGEYNIKIKYPDGEQILNIIVPYYQRLL